MAKSNKESLIPLFKLTHYLSIGVNALAFADKRRREADNETVYEFSDTEGFARDVVREMNDENDVGDSPLTDFLDSMVDAAIDNGSIYVE